MVRKKTPDAITVGAAYMAAITALEEARKYASQARDNNSLVEIANSWIEIGTQLLVNDVDLSFDDDTAPSTPKVPIGFIGDKGGEENTDTAPGTDQD